jgi:predicted Zn-dependent protease
VSARLRARDDANPVSGQGLLASVQLAAGRTEEAEALAQKVRTANPDLILPRVLLANLYVTQDRLAEARAMVAEVRAINPELMAEQASALGPAGLREEGVASLRRAGLP